MNASARSTIVIATHNRCERLTQTLRSIETLEDAARVIVVDNASRDGTSACVRKAFANVDVVTLGHNAGAYARTVGAQLARTPYVAFCDDDSWWKPGAIGAAVAAMDEHPQIALVNACLTVNGDERIDAACVAMEGDISHDELPGRRILYFLAGACVVRRDAFLACGGYEKRFFIGGEETLLALDLQRRGWHVRYLPSVGARHDPSPLERDDTLRRTFVTRNHLWVAWMRYAPSSAWRTTMATFRRARADTAVRTALLRAIGGLPWALLRRSRIDDSLQRRVDAAWRLE